MIEEYLKYIGTIKRYSPRTRQIYEDILRDFSDFVSPAPSSPAPSSSAPAPGSPAPSSSAPAQAAPDIPPGELTVQTLRAYEVHLLDEKKLSPRTVSLHLSVLSGYCRYLCKKGIIQSNPVRLVSRPRQKKRLPEFYRSQAMESYFEHTKGVPEFGSLEARLSRLIVSLLFGTGIRRAELISLNRNSIDFSRKTLRVKGKGDKVREIPLIDSLCEEISLYLQSLSTTAEDPDAPLLQTPRGTRLYPVFVDRTIKQELGNVEGITARKSPHVLRHTLATELLDAGADLDSIKELLGHSSLAATQVYTHNSVEKLRNVYNNAHPRAKNGGKNGN